jgi:uncharacterized protein
MARPLITPRRAVMALLTLTAFGYLGLCGWFWLNQRDFLYERGGTVATPAAVGLANVAVVRIVTEDGQHIVGWWLPPACPGHGVVLYLRGTPGTLADYAPYIMPDLAAAGLGVLAIDYRGFGGSTGTPSEAGISQDTSAAFDFIRERAPQSKIAVFGQSFGTGPAVELAARRPVAGVLLNAPYASFVRLFEQKAPPILPYRWLLTERYDAAAAIGRVTAPVMILHGTADATIPVAEARRLFAAAHQPKTMIEVEGAGHVEAWQGDAKAAALKALAGWTAPPATAKQTGNAVQQR